MYNNLLDAPATYKAGIYIRLSQEDKNKRYESESESVINQRNILMNYLNTNGFTFIQEYVDDGYSGTDFDRPGFIKMIEDVKAKKINLVIVKDLSRLGRDHVNTGYYMERFFPENRVRFVSIMESYDSARNQASNDSSTFIVACNDYYSKQNSNKIRDVLHAKKIDGKFIGSLPCFGYMRDPEDKGHLVPNPDTAPIVKKIFKMYSSGIGLSEIVSTLNNNDVLTPSGYKQTKFSSRLIVRDEWSVASVNKILKNRMYTGDMVQNVQTKINYKSKKKVKLDEKLWIIVENTHEALIDKATFYTIQKMPKRIPPLKVDREKRLFENIIYCKECGNLLTVTYKKHLDYWSVNCNRYSRDPKRRRCEPHFFPYEYLEKELLKTIRLTISNYINELNINELNIEIIKKQLSFKKDEPSQQDLFIQKENVLNELDALYKDKRSGLLSEDSYKHLVEPYEKELARIKKEIIKLENMKENEKSKIERLPDYTNKIQELLRLDKPSRELLFALIDKIEIDKDRNIEIIYKFNLIENDKIKYIGPSINRNPYGKKGKPKTC